MSSGFILYVGIYIDKTEVVFLKTLLFEDDLMIPTQLKRQRNKFMETLQKTWDCILDTSSGQKQVVELLEIARRGEGSAISCWEFGRQHELMQKSFKPRYSKEELVDIVESYLHGSTQYAHILLDVFCQINDTSRRNSSSLDAQLQTVINDTYSVWQSDNTTRQVKARPYLAVANRYISRGFEIQSYQCDILAIPSNKVNAKLRVGLQKEADKKYLPIVLLYERYNPQRDHFGKGRANQTEVIFEHYYPQNPYNVMNLHMISYNLFKLCNKTRWPQLSVVEGEGQFNLGWEFRNSRKFTTLKGGKER